MDENHHFDAIKCQRNNETLSSFYRLLENLDRPP